MPSPAKTQNTGFALLVVLAVVLGSLAVIGVVGVTYVAMKPRADADQAKPVASAAPPPDLRPLETVAASTDGQPAQSQVAPSSAPAQPDAADGLGVEMAQAQSQLSARLPENHGLEFRDVQTHIATVDGQPQVDFCGDVDVLDPAGHYVGFQKFISSAVNAQVERDMPPGEFTQAWSARCQGRLGPAIWK